MAEQMPAFPDRTFGISPSTSRSRSLAASYTRLDGAARSRADWAARWLAAILKKARRTRLLAREAQAKPGWEASGRALSDVRVPASGRQRLRHRSRFTAPLRQLPLVAGSGDRYAALARRAASPSESQHRRTTC